MSYSLVDSGAGHKLERFGSRLISRPSSLALWRKSKSQEIWSKADAHYSPEKGWKFSNRPFESWSFDCSGIQFELRLQKNGQVGVFPDHFSYLDELRSCSAGLRAKQTAPIRALNLFAYTGLATLALASTGGSVCHIDLSDQVLTWTKRNISLNPNISSNQVRLIPEDAFKFAEREAKRKSQYDILIADPPSFGRTSKTKSWKLEEVIHPFLKNCLQILNPTQHVLFLSCHHAALGPEVLANLIRDYFPKNSIISRSLGLTEEQTKRVLPAGHLVISSTTN